MDSSALVSPHNLEAERSVLGGILLRNEAFHDVNEMLQAEDFYSWGHRRIYEAISLLLDAGRPIDLVTLPERINQKGWTEEVGGLTYLATLADDVVTAANIGAYSRIVKEKSILRSMIAVAADLIREACREPEDAYAFLDIAEQKILGISPTQKRKDFVHLSKVLEETFHNIEEMQKNQGAPTGVPTGFKVFDRLTSGLQRTDLIILAGRTSMGKTALALNIARYAASHARVPVAIFSLEMNNAQLAQRLLCAEAEIDNFKIQKGMIARSEWARLTAAADTLSRAPIFIDDAAGLTAREIRGRARRLKREEDIGLIVVDYLQLVQGERNRENRAQEVQEISLSLKQLAKELRVPVLALAQLNRNIENRDNKTPRLADLRESGAIEQDADVIAFINREGTGGDTTEESRARTKLIIGKQRNGPVGVAPLYFRAGCTRFYDAVSDDTTLKP